MKNRIKIIFFDIDGTLVDTRKKYISPKMVEALNRLKRSKILICIATGRAPMELPQFDGVVFDAFLTYNGSLCYDQEQIIFRNPLSEDDVHTIIRNATALHRPLSLATKSRLAANGKDADLVEYFGFAKISVEVADDFNEVAQDEVYQIMLGCREQDHPQLMQGVHNAKVTSWWDRAVDIIPSNGGKGIGIEKVLEHYHLDKSEAMAFGDGNNDIEMLQTVGTGVAMANASDKLKKSADDICGDVRDDGIYDYLLAHHLIESEGD